MFYNFIMSPMRTHLRNSEYLVLHTNILFSRRSVNRFQKLSYLLMYNVYNPQVPSSKAKAHSKSSTGFVPLLTHSTWPQSPQCNAKETLCDTSLLQRKEKQIGVPYCPIPPLQFPLILKIASQICFVPVCDSVCRINTIL